MGSRFDAIKSVVLDRERGFVEGLRPTADALWALITEKFDAAVGWLDGQPEHDENSKSAAADHFETFQALYLLLRRYDYDAFILRNQFSVVELGLCSYLQETDRAYTDLGFVRDKEHRIHIRRKASEIEGEIAKERRKPATKATRRLKDSEVKEMLKAFTEVIYTNGRIVYFEDAFAVQMLRDWDKPMLTTTAHAVETLHIIERRKHQLMHRDPTQVKDAVVRLEVKPGVMAFVRSRYKVDHFTDPYDSHDLYATSSAISVFKVRLGLGSNERASPTQLRDLFPNPISYVAVRDWAKGELRRLLGLTDKKADASAAKLIDINHAVRILWNLSGDAAFPEQLSDCRDALHDFISRCMCHMMIKGRREACFTMSPATRAICLTACMGAARLIKQAQFADSELNEHLAQCDKYVRACMSPDSGFGSSVEHTPDLLHTYLALRLIKSQNWKALTDTEIEGVVRFMDLCYKDGGYALLPEWRASAYGTRLATQILGRLDVPLQRLVEMTAFIDDLLAADSQGREGYCGVAAQV